MPFLLGVHFKINWCIIPEPIYHTKLLLPSIMSLCDWQMSWPDTWSTNRTDIFHKHIYDEGDIYVFFTILFNHLFEFKHRIILINSFLIEHFSQCLFLLAMCVCAILFERMSHKNKPQKNEKLQHSFVCPVDIIGFPLLGCSLTI